MISIWETEPFAIKYVYDIERNFIPDFLVEYKNGNKELIEIHPKGLIGEKEKSKYTAAQEWCIKNNVNWRLITEL